MLSAVISCVVRRLGVEKEQIVDRVLSYPRCLTTSLLLYDLGEGRHLLKSSLKTENATGYLMNQIWKEVYKYVELRLAVRLRLKSKLLHFCPASLADRFWVEHCFSRPSNAAGPFCPSVVTIYLGCQCLRQMKLQRKKKKNQLTIFHHCCQSFKPLHGVPYIQLL